MKQIKFILITITVLTVLNLTAQNQKPSTSLKASFGKGIGFASADSSFTLTLSGRVQSMAEVKHELNSDVTGADFFVRRCRLNIQGKAFHPAFSYRIQIGFAQRDITADNSEAQNNLIMRDAMLFYEPAKWIKFGFGQTKLPGNRQRMISSANLQLVERSIVNNNFTIDRDKGIWMYNHFELKQAGILRTIFAVSSGEGRINSDKNGELCYSGRIEYLPLGAFTNGNDFIESDQEREKKPKLSIAGAYSYNSASSRTLGQLGEYLYNNAHTNIKYYGGDLLFKFRGFSFESEFYNREANNGIIINKLDSTQSNFVLSGRALLLQSGYLFKNGMELSLRYGRIDPANKLSSKVKLQEEHVFGFSKYFNKHSLKIQTDISYMKNGSKETLIYRLSGVVTF